MRVEVQLSNMQHDNLVPGSCKVKLKHTTVNNFLVGVSKWRSYRRIQKNKMSAMSAKPAFFGYLKKASLASRNKAFYIVSALNLALFLQNFISTRSPSYYYPTEECSPMESCIKTTISDKDSRITVFIIWQAPRAGSMRRILCSDWLPERARWSNTARPELPVWFSQIKFQAGARKVSFAEIIFFQGKKIFC